MGSMTEPTSDFNWMKVRTCFALLLVNALLIIGISISASRRVHLHPKPSPTPNNLTTLQVPPCSGNGSSSENIRLQCVDMCKIPEEIQKALMKVQRYMETNMIVNSTGICQFAWKFNSRDNSMELFICN
ncbi:hypothetical protein OS493_005499 [Desmophyllum pertusum]|uniref:Uncharacterized protein n=1 Tax=Desmophyllum pertusum TaxID=174260 RepID=A0A9W9YSC5_9CNID|nr:hypothetical protein OS493_005499 [Desmophyllum pertusum]